MALEPDRRRRRRETVRIDAKIVSDDLWCVVDCVIVDKSPDGARLRLHWPTALPARFDLVIPSERQIVSVRAVWRRGQNAGVQFMGEARQAASGLC